MTAPKELKAELKVGDMVEMKSGTGRSGAHGMFHGITPDGRYDIELGFNLDWPHRHIYVSNSDFRPLPSRRS